MVIAAWTWSDVVPGGDASRSKLPGVGAEEAEHSRHSAETDLLIESQECPALEEGLGLLLGVWGTPI